MVNNGFKICGLKVFFIITILSLVLVETCPGLSGWDIRATSLCKDDPQKYHCLENQEGEIKEVCITPIDISKGYFPVLSIGEDVLLERPCPKTHYQPNRQPSNQYKSVTCTYIKGVCEDDGEETCDDGDTTRDRMCRCDYTRGYASNEYLLNNPRLKSCYRPKSEVQGCVMLPCKNGTELNKAYQCVPICPSGYFRPKFEFGCVPRQKTLSPSTSTELMTTKADDDKSRLMTTKTVDDQSRQKEVPGMTDQVMGYTIPILSACISAMFVVSVVSMCITWKRKIRMRIKRCKSGDESDSESFELSEGGEKHRKAVDDVYSYKDGDIIHENKLKYRIGCIMTGKECGTGFRVGERHVLTAYHVVQGVYENLWKTVIRRLKQLSSNEDIKDILLEFGNNSTPGDGKWSLTDLSERLDSKTRENFKSIGKRMVQDECKIIFGYVDEKNRTPFTFSYDAPFISTKHDVAILELLTEESNDSLPDPLSLADLYTPADYLYVVGHPAGRKLIIDPRCQILSDESHLKSTVEEGIKLFSSLGEKRTEVEKEYSECKISQNHIFFHCSKSTAHGASGSPLIRITKEEVPEVIGILLKGYPKLYYNKYSQNKKVDKRPDVLIESGVSMEMVKNLLHEHELVDLGVALFRR